MAGTFTLPRIGDAMSEGEIVEWFVAVGDAIELDQVICAIETDKSVVELSTPYRGTVLALGGAPGDVIEVGAPLLTVGEPGEAVPDANAAAGTRPAATAPLAAAAVPPTALSGNDGGSDRRLLTSPLVRKLAADLGVDIEVISGTGPGGRITRVDVEAAAPASPDFTAVNDEGTTSNGAVARGSILAMPKVRLEARHRGIDLTTVEGSGPRGSITLDDLDSEPVRAERRERLSAMRRSIATHLTQSVQTIPQFTSTVDVDATAVLATRKALRERFDTPVPIDAVLTALMIPVLRDHPIVNACLDGDDIVYYERYDIGIAVDTPDGLMLPVVRAADTRPIAELGAEIVRLATAARERTIRPDELTGATCTVNNVGALGVVAGTPILPLGTSTIVAFGVARPLVQLRNGNPVEVPTLTISATFDHRLIDGGGSGRFLAQLKQHLEVPALGLL